MATTLLGAGVLIGPIGLSLVHEQGNIETIANLGLTPQPRARLIHASLRGPASCTAGRKIRGTMTTRGAPFAGRHRQRTA
jgi:hypothetical protein